mmetsp:Transcript_40915/g.87133  ORF Transcript_40915/g.87133 Transcript_40915/m.87133 type:complete len:243 (+) Transcript_40915:551-1279(+)
MIHRGKDVETAGVHRRLQHCKAELIPQRMFHGDEKVLAGLAGGDDLLQLVCCPNLWSGHRGDVVGELIAAGRHGELHADQEEVAELHHEGGSGHLLVAADADEGEVRPQRNHLWAPQGNDHVHALGGDGSPIGVGYADDLRQVVGGLLASVVLRLLVRWRRFLAPELRVIEGCTELSRFVKEVVVHAARREGAEVVKEVLPAIATPEAGQLHLELIAIGDAQERGPEKNAERVALRRAVARE